MSRHIAYIDITLKVDCGNLQEFLDYMTCFQEEVEEVIRTYGELLEYNIHEGDDEDEQD